jgi:hypothetical protein
VRTNDEEKLALPFPFVCIVGKHALSVRFGQAVSSFFGRRAALQA